MTAGRARLVVHQRPAEREYLAVFSSQLNRCPFCVRMHTEVAGI